MEFLINNSSDIQNLKEVFENKNELQSTPFFETVSPQENEKLSMECLDEEEISYQTKSTEMDDDFIPDSFSKYLVDTSLIPKEVFEKKLFHEILKKKDKDNLLLYYCLGKKDEPSPELKEFFELIEKKVYFYFYKLFQSEEWEELLYEKIIL